MNVIANHAHLMPSPKTGDWWPSGNADMLLDNLDRCGISAAVVFPPFACQMNNDLLLANRWALDQCRQHPDRFIPAGNWNPLSPQARDALRFFTNNGIRIVKIHPSIDLHDIQDPRCRELYALAQEAELILDYHTGAHGTRLALAKPEKFDDLACDYPKLRLIFEHIGGRTYFEEFTAIISNHRGQAFAGLTSVFCRDTHPLWHLGLARILDLIHCAGADSIIFGLDFPWNTSEHTRRHLEMIASLDLTDEAKEKILGGNLRRLLKISDSYYS